MNKKDKALYIQSLEENMALDKMFIDYYDGIINNATPDYDGSDLQKHNTAKMQISKFLVSSMRSVSAAIKRDNRKSLEGALKLRNTALEEINEEYGSLQAFLAS